MAGANVWKPQTLVAISADTKSVEELIVATAAQVLFPLTKFVYVIGTGALEVHRNGLLLAKGVDWAEQTDSTFSLVVPATAGDEVIATAKVGITGTVVPVVANSYIQDFAALTSVIADADLLQGDAVLIADRADGVFDIVTGEVGNTYDIIQLTGTVFQAKLRVNGQVNIVSTGAVSDATGAKTDNRGAIQAAIDISSHTYVPKGDFGWIGMIDVGTNKLTGDGQQNSKMYSFDATNGTKLTFSSGAVLEGIKVFGPWTATQDVTIENVGVSDETALEVGGGSNRAIMRDFRVESFGVNVLLYQTQNMTLDGVMCQYAKYIEFFFDDTRNTFLYSCNSNGRSGVGAPLVSVGYSWIKADGAKNLFFWGGIHERATDIVKPVDISLSSTVHFNGVEFNAALTEIMSVRLSSEATLDNCLFTCSGLGENLVVTDSTSKVNLRRITATGLGGASLKSRLIGNVGNTEFFNDTPLKDFRADSGGAGTMEDGILAVQGANGTNGIAVDDRSSNNSFIKLTGDGLGAYNLEVNVVSVSGVGDFKFFIGTDNVITGGFRRVVSSGHTTAGHYKIPVLLQNGDIPTIMGIGVFWDGSTVDPTYGNVGVVRVTGISAELVR